MTEQLSITLPDDVARAINERVDAGLYSSASEAVSAAVRALLRDEQENEARLSVIRERVRESVEDTRPSVSIDEARIYINRIYSRQKS